MDDLISVFQVSANQREAFALRCFFLIVNDADMISFFYAIADAFYSLLETLALNHFLINWFSFFIPHFAGDESEVVEER